MGGGMRVGVGVGEAEEDEALLAGGGMERERDERLRRGASELSSLSPRRIRQGWTVISDEGERTAANGSNGL